MQRFLCESDEKISHVLREHGYIFNHITECKQKNELLNRLNDVKKSDWII